MQVIKTMLGVPRLLHLHDATLISGLSLSDFTIVIFSESANILSSSTFTLREVEAGHYTISLSFPSVGNYYFSIEYTTFFEEYSIDVENEDISFLARRSAASDSEYEMTVVDDQGLVVPSALVKVFNYADTKVITKGTTNQLGKITFTLEVGSYKARVSKEGYSFTSINPVSFTVVASDEVNPVIKEFLPTAVDADSTLCIKGLNFSTSTVAFLDGVQTSLQAVSVDGNTVLVSIPADATDSISIQLGNPDPSTPGSYLKSKLFNLVVL